VETDTDTEDGSTTGVKDNIADAESNINTLKEDLTTQIKWMMKILMSDLTYDH